jgi:hypothetical protein
MGWLGGSGRRARIGAVVAAAVVGVAWQTGDWWQTGGANTNLTVARVLLFLTVLALVYALAPVIRRVSRPAWIVFGGWTLYGGLWLFAMWPGLVMTDTQDMVARTSYGVVYEWFSYLHSLINLAVLDIVPHVATFGVLQVLGTAALMAFASTIALEVRRSIPALVAMNVIAALSAPVVANTILYSRDTIFGLVHVALALYLARGLILRRRFTAGQVLGIAVVTSFLSAYRGDGIVLLVVVPALILVLRPPRAAIVRGAAVFAAAVVVFHVLLPATLEIQDEGHRYELSLKWNPLSAVLRSNFYSQTKEQDLRDLGRVIDVEGVKQTYNPAGIDGFWLNKWNQRASESDYKVFNSVASRLIRENAWTVLANRVETFGAAAGLGPGQFNVPPLGLDPYPANGVERRFWYLGFRQGLVADSPWPALYRKGQAVLERTTPFTGTISTRSAVHWNFLPWMLVLIGTLLAWRRVPVEAVIAAVLLCRVPLVFVAAPAGQFKYYYSVHLGGILVLGLLLARVRRAHVARFVPRLRRAEQAQAAA